MDILYVFVIIITFILVTVAALAVTLSVSSVCRQLQCAEL